MKTPRLQAVLGAGGTGKSYRINEQIREDPTYAFRTATTGIAAVNMGTLAGCEDPTTINRALRYFNAEELLRNFHTGKVTVPLKLIANKYKNIIVDEISMMDAGTLDVIVMALQKFNNEFNKDLGLIVSGDPGQLPPVSGKPFFQAKAWPNFRVEFLTEVKRQKDEDFINALNLVRVGKVKEAADWFESNITFLPEVDDSFRGTTFFSTNREVDAFNKRCLNKLVGKSKIYKAELTGNPPRAWNNIPQQIELKPGCVIQLLYNSLDGATGFANGDSAIVNELWEKSIYISLLRKGKELYLRPRTFQHFNYNAKGYRNPKPIATLKVLHARLAYALTIHKSQGLTLDGVQLNLKGTGSAFLSKQSGMLYTALSRVRSPKGLQIVGSVDDLIRCCYINPKYLEWIR